MLIPGRTLEAIAAGRVTLAFRRWRRPTVKAGGTLRTAVGVLSIDAVDRVDPADIDDAAARAAGFDGRAALLAKLERGQGDVYRIGLHLSGEDPRIALREDTALDAGVLREIGARLERMDARSRSGRWTRAVLETIAARPATRAADLARAAGRETPAFKADVRKLKELGLTESLEIGYRLSPRGQTVLEHLRATDA